MIDLSKKYDHYARRLKDAMDARNLTNEEMAARMDSHPVTISKLRTGRITLDDEWRARAAAAFPLPEELLFGEGILPEPEPHEFFRPAKRRGRKPINTNELPVYKLQPGVIEGHLVMTSEVMETTPCPPGLVGVTGAYALRMVGDTMIPRYFPRDLLYIHPHQAVASGDHVIVQVRHQDHLGAEIWIKRYDGHTENDILVSQYSPAARITFRRDYVQELHRILPINELLPAR